MTDDLDRIRQWRERMAPRARLVAELAGDGGLVHIRDVDLLLSEIDRRDAILRTLAAVKEPIYDSMYCMLCDSRPGDHAGTCPWRQAKELIGDE